MKYINKTVIIKILNRVLFVFIIVLLFHNANSQKDKNFREYKKNIKKTNNFFKELFYNESPINVDFGNLDEDVRNLQLLGKIPSSNSLIIRPYYPELTHIYDSILKLIDPNISNKSYLVKKEFLKINLLPISFTQKYNSDHPFGWNDGSFNYSRGYQYKFNSGFNIKLLNLDININPEYLNISNDNYFNSSLYGDNALPIRKLNLGNSSLKFNLSKITIGFSNQNLWYGSGSKNALLISNSAPGFPHGFFSTNRPLNIYFGYLQFAISSGILKYDSSQTFENLTLKKRLLLNRDRYLNTLVLVFQPKVLKNIFFEFERQFQNYNKVESLTSFSKVFPVFNGVTTEQFDDKNYAQDQQIVLGSRWIHPNSNSEYYIQFGWNDGKKNLRDLAMDMAHSSAYILGFKKLIPINNYKFISFNFENLRMSQTPSYLHRNAGNWYEHGQILEGLTNLNQILGSGIGMGNNMNSFDLNYNNKFFKYGIGFMTILNNPNQVVLGIENLGIRDIRWKDLVLNLNFRLKYNKFLISANASLVTSKNFAYQQNNNRTNISLMLNTLYIW